MFYIDDLLQNGVIWLVLAIAIISRFFNHKLWLVALTISLILIFVSGRIDYAALGFIVSGLAIAKWQQHVAEKLKMLLTSVVVLWSLVLAAHLLPGVDNLKVVDQAITGSLSIPFTMYLNLDKPVIFFAFLLLLPNLLKQQAKLETLFGLNVLNSYKPLLIILSLFSLVFMIAVGFMLIKPEFSLPQWWWLFMLNNLFFVCIIEEVFFRGFIQQKLTQKLSPEIALLITSVLFGLVHFSGGIVYVFVATIAGLLYGFTYMYTGRVSAAIAMHFTLNMVHFLCFTYPMAK